MLSRIRTMLTGDGRRSLLYVLALVTALGGVTALTVGLVTQQSATPAPHAIGTISPQAKAPHSTSPKPESPGIERAGGTDRASRKDRIRVLPASKPTSITIPAIDVHSDVFAIGKKPDGTIRVPQSGPNLNKAAWYENSPTPGQPGPSIIEGHIDSEQQGPSVFWRLSELRPGDTVKVTRADGTVTVFTVDALRTYPKDQFPTKAIYGGDLKHPQLRLITCATFDDSIDHYVGNLIVFTHMTSVHQAG